MMKEDTLASNTDERTRREKMLTTGEHWANVVAHKLEIPSAKYNQQHAFDPVSIEDVALARQIIQILLKIPELNPDNTAGALLLDQVVENTQPKYYSLTYNYQLPTERQVLETNDAILEIPNACELAVDGIKSIRDIANQTRDKQRQTHERFYGLYDTTQQQLQVAEEDFMLKEQEFGECRDITSS